MNDDAQPGEWVLLREVPKDPAHNLTYELAYIRRVSSAEYEEIDLATRVLVEHSTMWPWHKIVNSANQVIDALNSLTESTARSNNVNQADVQRIELAVRALGHNIHTWLEAIQADEQAQPEVANEVLRIKTPSSPIDLLTKIDAIEAGRLIHVELVDAAPTFAVQVTLSNEYRAAASFAGVIPIEPLTRLAVQSLNRLAALTLLSDRDSVEQSARCLTALAGECIFGNPVLIPSAKYGAITDDGNLALTRIRLDLVLPLMTAIRQAVTLLSVPQPLPTKLQSQDTEDTSATSNDTGRAGNSSIESDQTLDNDQSSSGNELVHATTPIDLTLLLNEVSSLTADTEFAWSAALQTRLKSDNDQLRTRWISFVTAVTRAIGEQERTIAARGGRVPVLQFPLNVAAANDISRTPDTDQLLQQSMLSLAYSIRGMVDATKPLTQPTLTQRVNAQWGRVWWESGAFGRLRNQASALARIFHYTWSLVHSNDSGDSDRQTENNTSSQWQQTALRASLALQQGLVEASLVYSSLSLRQLLGSLGIDHEALNDRVSQYPELAELRPAISTTFVVAAELASGKEVSPGVVWPIAYFWENQLRFLVSQRKYCSDDPTQSAKAASDDETGDVDEND